MRVCCFTLSVIYFSPVITLIKVKRQIYKEDRLKRTQRLSLMLNNREMRALGIYCNRYRIKNKSGFLRETIMKAILQRIENEHPTLWEEPEPTLFNQNLMK